MKKKRRDTEGLSLSFLDCICCGFGAIILLLILTQASEPRIRQEAQTELKARVASLREEVERLGAEEKLRAADLEKLGAQTSSSAERDAELEAELARLRSALTALKEKDAAPAAVEARLLLAKQTLSEEMKRLYGSTAMPRRPDAPIGGIPVDSDYLIFVIDTSGSMFNFAWSEVIDKVAEALDVYPRLQGIQILNDEGGYMFPDFQGRWIPDTPSRRKAVLDTLRTWRPFSNSSPVEGIETAIRAFYRPDRKISIYVFGDDYSGDSLASVIGEVDRLNVQAEGGERRVRIHAVGFPVQYMSDQVTRSGYRFAHLMRVLCERNGGAFVGLPKLRLSGAAELLRARSFPDRAP
jgi:uncharacterized small protein (DUF1192 family)